MDELVRRWFTPDLTPDQAIGQLLQVIQDLLRRVEDLESRKPQRKIGSPH